MTFHENVLREINSGQLKEPFSPADVRALGSLPDGRFKVGDGSYAKSMVDTFFANNSQTVDGVEQGATVKGGAQPKYWRVRDAGSTRYIAIRASFLDSDLANELLAEFGVLEDSEEPLETPTESDDWRTNSQSWSVSGLSAMSISDQFVDYIANKPFRLYSYERPRAWYPLLRPVVGWKERLNAYLWNGTAWAGTLASLSPLVEGLTSLRRNLQAGASIPSGTASGLFSRVVQWGGTKHTLVADDLVESAILDVDGYLLSGAVLPSIPTAPINSTWTKVYAFAFPDDFVIYDTRVAAAIISVAEDLYRRNHNHANNKRGVEANIEDFRKVFGALGTMTNASRGGTRPRGARYRHWPAAYCSWAAQIDANILCKGIRDSLNRQNIDDRNDWTLREVEAVLFMEGY